MDLETINLRIKLAAGPGRLALDPAQLEALAIAANDALEAAYQRGREDERSEWNPMVGRVLQVTQSWAVCTEPMLRDAARTIHDAIGDR